MNNLANSLTDTVISEFISWLPLLIAAAALSIAIAFIEGRINRRNARKGRNRR